MVLLHSKIIGTDIFELRTQTKVGVASELLIQKGDLKISGIILKSGSFLSSTKKVISTTDIMEITQNAIIINDDEAVVNIDETVRLKESLKEGFYGIHQRVTTKSGKKIGLVFDFLVDSQTLSITKFYIRTLLAEKIISSDLVVDLRGKNLVIKDEYEKVKLTSPAIGASVI